MSNDQLNIEHLEALLNEFKRCFTSIEITGEMPKDTCAADMVHLISEYLEKGNLYV